MAVNLDDPSLRPSAVPWPPILLATAIVTAVALGRFVPVSWPGEVDTAAIAVGWGLVLAGFVLTSWAVMTFRHQDTEILPHRQATRLVTSGPYAWRRIPIYLGEMLMLGWLEGLGVEVEWVKPVGLLASDRLLIVKEHPARL